MNNSSQTIASQRRILTAEDVSEMLQVDVGTVKYLHRVGVLRAVRIGKHNRWRLEDVEQYIESIVPRELS